MISLLFSWLCFGTQAYMVIYVVWGQYETPKKTCWNPCFWCSLRYVPECKWFGLGTCWPMLLSAHVRMHGIDAHMLTNRSQHFINCSPQPGHYTFQQLSISYNYMWIWYVLIVYIYICIYIYIYIVYTYISILYVDIIHEYNVKRISYITHIYIFTHYSHYRHISWRHPLENHGLRTVNLEHLFEKMGVSTFVTRSLDGIWSSWTHIKYH